MGRTFLERAAMAGLRYRLFDSLHLGLAKETRDYVRATREQFIAHAKRS
jgi:hypothetical protein